MCYIFEFKFCCYSIAGVAFETDITVVIDARSFVAYAENYTITLTHGFTMLRRSSPPQYLDMAGMKGKIVYSEGDVDIPFKPCDLWRSDKDCGFVLGKHKYLASN
jgi:hypothetical protein